MSGSRLPNRGQRRHAAAVAVAAAVTATAGAAAAWHLLLLVPGAAARGAQGPAGPLLALACLLAAVVLGRLSVAALATTAWGAAAWLADARSTGGRCRELCAWLALVVSPRLVRPLLASLLAGAVALGTAASANAASPPSATPTQLSTTVGGGRTPTSPTSADALGDDRFPLPDPAWSTASADAAQSDASPPMGLPAPTWTPQRPPAPRREHVDVSTVAAAPSRGREPAPVVVRRGDTLWSIAARHLGAGATDADVAREWPRWWTTNRAVVGGDPDLLRPGQVLTPPTSGGAR